MNIFNEVIQTYLKGKTVIFATHALQYIPYVKHVIHMNRGVIDFYGSAEEAANKDFFRKYVRKEKRKNSVVPSNQPLMELVDTEFETVHNHEDKNKKKI